MNDCTLLRDAIIEFFANTARAYELEGICEKYEIECDKTLNPSSSKRSYLKSGFAKKSFEQIKDIARQIIFEGCDTSFVHEVEPYLNDDFFAIPMIVRRTLLNWICSQADLEGAVDIIQLLSPAWNIDGIQIIGWDQEPYNAREYLTQHMIRNDDISYEQLFEELLEFIYIPDRQLIKFIETLVNPPVRSNGNQNRYVKEINCIIDICGYRLISQKSIAGNPIYTLEKASGGIDGKICNIVFGAIGGKPDIVIDDALTNRLAIVQDKVDCLFYTNPITSRGLSWHELVTWWNSGNDAYDLAAQQALVKRLTLSLDSEPEVLFLRTYYNFIYKQHDNNLPALIPQVYCHYDPKTAKMRNGQVYVHQRMDFLLLLPGNIRIVIEIDGSLHYSDSNGNPSPQKYADMVRDDRMLKLYGYEVYRFGGFEFIDATIATANISAFIKALFEKYGI
ncbi:MAG: hypothetical protein HDT38_01135 [Clostridiales bacterium]|nr:hypothetical protein [Clostridiales bacterium]